MGIHDASHPVTLTASEELRRRARTAALTGATFVGTSLFASGLYWLWNQGFSNAAWTILVLWLLVSLPWLAMFAAIAGDLVLLLMSGRAHAVPAIFRLGEAEDRRRELAGEPPEEEGGGLLLRALFAFIQFTNPLTPLAYMALMYIRRQPSVDSLDETVELIQRHRTGVVPRISRGVGRDIQHYLGGRAAPQH